MRFEVHSLVLKRVDDELLVELTAEWVLGNTGLSFSADSGFVAVEGYVRVEWEVIWRQAIKVITCICVNHVPNLFWQFEEVEHTDMPLLPNISCRVVLTFPCSPVNEGIGFRVRYDDTAELKVFL